MGIFFLKFKLYCFHSGPGKGKEGAGIKVQQKSSNYESFCLQTPELFAELWCWVHVNIKWCIEIPFRQPLLSSSSPVFRVVFSQRKMDMKINEVIFKMYVMSMETFYFGPLLCGKSRDK